MAGFLRELTVKKWMERGYKHAPVTKADPWNDQNFLQLEFLAEFWRVGRDLRRLIVSKRASGQPFEEEKDLLLHVRDMCRAQLEAWQPTEQQRKRAH